MNPTHDRDLESGPGSEPGPGEGSEEPQISLDQQLEQALADATLDPDATDAVRPDEAGTAGPAEGMADASESDALEVTEPGAAEAPETPIEELRAEADRFRQEAENNRERWLRAMAELENTRKRFKRDLKTSINLANANLLRDLLDVVDNFDRALATVEGEEEPSAKAVGRGIRLIYGQFMDVLRQSGLSRIDARGEPFDPNLHEALSQKETDEFPSHTVIEVVQEGYLLRDKVLRPARVIVAA